MFRCENFYKKEVINIRTAERVGYVADVEIDEGLGNVEALVVAGKGSFLWSIFGCGEVVIPYSSVKVVGKDVILADVIEEEEIV